MILEQKVSAGLYFPLAASKVQHTQLCVLCSLDLHPLSLSQSSSKMKKIQQLKTFSTEKFWKKEAVLDFSVKDETMRLLPRNMQHHFLSVSKI